MTHTPSPRKRKRIVKVLLAVVALTVVAAAAGMWRAVFGPSLQAPEEGLAVYVPTGTTPQQLVELLRPHLRHTFLLETMTDYASRRRGQVHPGKFVLPQGLSTYRTVKTFFTEHGVEVNVRFNATDRLEKIAGAVARQIEADSVALMAVFRDPARLDSLGLDTLTVSSLFIPNTYRFYWNTSAEEFFERM